MILTLILFATISAGAPLQTYNLPVGAVTIETRSLASQGHANRTLVLWMIKPKKNARRGEADEPYTCPEYTRGSYNEGPTRVSLVDTTTRRVINTIKVVQEYSENEDSFDLPYLIQAGMYYHVPQITRAKEGKPTIMWLRDYNGDGKPLEFALFDAQACMGLATTLIGYSERQDKVIQYPVQLAVKGDEKGKPESETRISHWCDYLFSKKPIQPGHWKYDIDYRGRAGSLDKYDIRYNAAKEMFEGSYVWTARDDGRN